MPTLIKTGLTVAISIALSSAAYAADVYIADPNTAQVEAINDFATPLGLTVVGAGNTGLSVSDRRLQIQFTPGTVTIADADSDLATLSASGSLTSYLYKVLNDGAGLDADSTANGSFAYTGNLALGTGSTGSQSNLPLLLDLGEVDLSVSGNLEAQGAIFITTVNSLASSGGLSMDGSSGLGIDASRTGSIVAAELIEQTSGNPANMKVMLDLNSTLENGASFILAQETAGNAGNTFSYSALDSENSRVFDSSYVINSAASRAITGNNERIEITFSRANNEYIEKSFTRNHPSNNAALALGTLAADGVALGDMQTALTLLDINDFGFGNNATNLATEVKRLAPIANNSLMISNLAAVSLAGDAIDYRLSARRANWSGYSKRPDSFWARGLIGMTRSNGSVPIATSDSQDTAGHDGFSSKTRGSAFGFDHQVGLALAGVSYAATRTRLQQSDDRSGETSNQSLRQFSLYGQLKDRYRFVHAAYTVATGIQTGERRTAVNRVANYAMDTTTQDLSVKAGRRFDMADGRTAMVPYVRLARTRYREDAYTETGAGDLSLTFGERTIERNRAALGLDISHKRRIGGLKALSVLSGAIGKDLSISDLTVKGAYTGTTAQSYLNFTTPAERWAANFVQIGADLQIEPTEALMIKFGVDGEFRNGRQSYATELGLVWVF